MSASNFFNSFKIIFSITFSQIIRSKKTVFMSILAFLPVLIAIYYRLSGRQSFIPPDQALSHVMVFFLLFLSVLISLFYGTALIADEIDNKTIIYLFTRPVKKYWIVFGKFAVYMLGVLLILIPPMILTFLIIAIGGGMSSDFLTSLGLFGKRLGVTVLALIVYGMIFMFLGTWRKYSVLIGLLFAFGWEKMIILVPGVVRKFSVVHYLISIYPGNIIKSKFIGIPEGMITNSTVTTSIVILLVTTFVFLGLSIFTIYRKEYRLEL